MQGICSCVVAAPRNQFEVRNGNFPTAHAFVGLCICFPKYEDTKVGNSEFPIQRGKKWEMLFITMVVVAPLLSLLQLYDFPNSFQTAHIS